MNNNSSENEELNTPDNTVCILLATGVNKLNKPQLISELNKRGLIDTGLVPELKNRLLKYLNGESLPTDFSAFEEHNFDPIINGGKLNRMDSKKPYFDPGRFSGSISENIDSFLKKYNRAASINGWTSDDKSQYIAACLEGSALTFFENSEDNALVKTKWEDLEHKLRTKFEPIAQTDMLRILLGKRKQLDDEQTTSYINDAESLCKRVDPLMPQPEMVRNIIKGLKPTVARYIGILENNNITDLKANIRKFEMIEFMITGEQTKAPSEIKTSIFKDQLNNITIQLEENIKLMNNNNLQSQETFKKLNDEIEKNKNKQFKNTNYPKQPFQQKLNNKFQINKPFYNTQNTGNNQMPQPIEQYPSQNFKNNQKCDNCNYNNHLTKDCRFNKNPNKCQLCDKVGHLAKNCWIYFPQSKNQ